MSKLIALLDACVLYPAPLRDLFMQLALTDLFQAKWSHHIHEEWTRNLLKNKPNITREKLEKIREMMDSNIRDCLVENYESIISTLSLPDKNDRHVLAAAIKSSASVIVTYNLKDFPKKTLRQYNVEARHPDNFIVDLFAINAKIVCEAASICRKRLQKPSMDVGSYLDNLEKQSLPKIVAKLREFSRSTNVTAVKPEF